MWQIFFLVFSVFFKSISNEHVTIWVIWKKYYSKILNWDTAEINHMHLLLYTKAVRLKFHNTEKKHCTTVYYSSH